jgi:hypothetical protein
MAYIEAENLQAVHEAQLHHSNLAFDVQLKSMG